MNGTKEELCRRLSKKTGLTMVDLKPVIETMLDEVITILAEGRKIELRGFGVFYIRKMKKKVGRNPRTGQEIMIPACETPAFKFSQDGQDNFKKKVAPNGSDNNNQSV